jgi:hypothetical protein
MVIVRALRSGIEVPAATVIASLQRAVPPAGIGGHEATASVTVTPAGGVTTDTVTTPASVSPRFPRVR